MRAFLLGLVVLCLPAGQDDIEAKLKEFADAMKGAAADADRVAAIHALARTRHLKATLKLTQVLGGPYGESVKIATAEAIGKIGDPKAGPGLQSALNSFGMLLASENPKTPGDQKVAEAIVRAIGSCKDHTAVPRLMQILTKNNIPLMAESVRALAKIRDLSCMDGLLRLHYAANSPEAGGAINPRKPLAPDTLAALRRITGQKYTTPDEWQKWWKAAGSGFRPPSEESLGGLPPAVQTWALYSGKGELKTLAQYDLVLLDPENYTKEELSELRTIAIKGDPKEAMDKGCAGILVNPDEAADMRKKFPRALLVSRGEPGKAASHLNAALVETLDPKKPEPRLVEALKEARSRQDVVTLALFVAEKKEDIAAATKYAKDQGFLPYVSPDKEHSKISPP